jgi:predicted MPP superfamily phosphohydrolase
MFLVVLTAVLVSMHLYVWKRSVKDTTAPGWSRRLLTVVLVGLGVLLAATLILPRMFALTDVGWFAWPGWLWFAVVAYLFLLTALLEPVRMIGRRWVRRRQPEPENDTPATGLDRRLFLARATAATAGVASVALVGVGATRALGPPDIRQIPVRLRRLDPAFTGYRIAVVSDIHLGPLAGRAHTARIVETINSAAPDLVAVVGDLVDGTVAQLGAAAEPLQDLVSRDGTFFVTGNHEYFVDDTMSWLRELERLGVSPLRNESTAIRRGGAAFDLAGVNDLAGAARSDAPDFDRALAATEASRPTVLLAHQPVMVEQAAARGVDLQLSGHTHGGQMWPFHYLVRLAQPALAGLSTVEGTQLYVTRGAGFWGPPVRIGAPPDVTVVSLAPEPRVAGA